MLPNCSVCLNSAHVVCADPHLNLYRCRLCYHGFTVKPKELYEVYEESYYSEKHPNWFKNPNIGHFRRLHRIICSVFPDKKARVLDIGCGNGDFLKYLAETNRGFELWGIDSIERRHPGVHFVAGDFFTHDFGGPFDVIVNLMVIEHLENPRAFVKKIYESLKPGGLLILTTNNDGGMLYAIARFLNIFGIHAAYNRIYVGHHLQHFTNRSLRKVLEAGGFEVQSFLNHNYPLKAVDTPPAGFLTTKIYLGVVWVVFRLSEFFGNEFLQTYVCRKPATKP